MDTKNMTEISLQSLIDEMPTLSPGAALSLVEAASVCFDEQGHSTGVEMEVTGSYKKRFAINWPLVTEAMKNSWHDEQVTTENGAYCIALLLIKELTEFTFVQRSRKSTGFDYWLGTPDSSLFQNMARLEVSGIRCGDTNAISTRQNIKSKQIDKSNTHLPGYVVVVEFGTPISHMVEK